MSLRKRRSEAPAAERHVISWHPPGGCACTMPPGASPGCWRVIRTVGSNSRDRSIHMPGPATTGKRELEEWAALAFGQPVTLVREPGDALPSYLVTGY
jgi:hypothetical protein